MTVKRKIVVTLVRSQIGRVDLLVRSDYKKEEKRFCQTAPKSVESDHHDQSPGVRTNYRTKDHGAVGYLWTVYGRAVSSGARCTIHE